MERLPRRKDKNIRLPAKISTSSAALSGLICKSCLWSAFRQCRYVMDWHVHRMSEALTANHRSAGLDQAQRLANLPHIWSLGATHHQMRTFNQDIVRRASLVGPDPFHFYARLFLVPLCIVGWYERSDSDRPCSRWRHGFGALAPTSHLLQTSTLLLDGVIIA